MTVRYAKKTIFPIFFKSTVWWLTDKSLPKPANSCAAPTPARAMQRKAAYQHCGRCVTAVSEGIRDASGAPIASLLAKDLEHDAHGDPQLSCNGALANLLWEKIKSKLKIKRVRGDTFGYLQRSFIGCVSDVDQREACEVGEKAV